MYVRNVHTILLYIVCINYKNLLILSLDYQLKFQVLIISN